MDPVTLTRSQYESLLAAIDGDEQVDTAAIRAAIDSANGIQRFLLRIRWLETGGSTAVPFSIREGGDWPPQQTFELRQDRAIAREDVDDVVRTQATNPVDVQVTPDPAGVVGWTGVDDYDFLSNAT